MQLLNTEIVDQTLIITMDNGGNPFNIVMLEALTNAFNQASENEELRAIIITGNKLFSAGGDVFGMLEGIEKGETSTSVNSIITKAAELVISILEHPLPIIAAINRAAAGAALSMAMACDHRIAETKAKLVIAFGTLAIIPDSGASYLFPLRFGQSITLHNSNTGAVMLAEDAIHTDAIDKVTDNLIDESMKIAQSYYSTDKLTVTRTKQLLNHRIIKEIKEQFTMEEKIMEEMTARQEFRDRVRNVAEKLKS